MPYGKFDMPDEAGQAVRLAGMQVNRDAGTPCGEVGMRDEARRGHAVRLSRYARRDSVDAGCGHTARLCRDTPEAEHSLHAKSGGVTEPYGGNIDKTGCSYANDGEIHTNGAKTGE